MTDRRARRARRAILVVCAVTVAVVVIESRVAASTLSARRTDVVVALLVGAVVLLSLPSLAVHRLGLGVATVAYLLWSALVSHPLEGPTLYIFPGELGFGVHVSDIVLSAMIVAIAWWSDRQLRGGSVTRDTELGAAGPMSSDR